MSLCALSQAFVLVACLGYALRIIVYPFLFFYNIYFLQKKKYLHEYIVLVSIYICSECLENGCFCKSKWVRF